MVSPQASIHQSSYLPFRLVAESPHQFLSSSLDAPGSPAPVANSSTVPRRPGEPFTSQVYVVADRVSVRPPPSHNHRSWAGLGLHSDWACSRKKPASR